MDNGNNGNNGGYKKPISMGVNLEGTNFSHGGGAGFNVNHYSGRLGIKSWKSGQNSSQNRDNQTTMSRGQVMYLNRLMGSILMERHAQFEAGEPYTSIFRGMNVMGFGKGGVQVKYGTIVFDTVDIDGTLRVRMTTTRGEAKNEFVFCDTSMTGIALEGSDIEIKVDVLDCGFAMLATDVHEYTKNGWLLGGFNKLFASLMNKGGNSYNRRSNGGGNYGGGNGGGNDYGNGGGGNSPRHHPDDNINSNSPLFSDDGDL